MEATHAVYWLPAWGWSDGQPYWGLVTAADFEQSIIAAGRIPRCSLSRDTDLNPLAQWVSNRVGYRVELVKDEHQIRKPGSPEWETAPFCWVFADISRALQWPPAVS